jgi:hypothetical protein
MSQTPLVTGMILGGVVISALGAASTHFVEEKKPTVKSLGRDFIIGSIMVAMIMQLLPESTTSIVEFLVALAPLTLFTAGKTTESVEVKEEMEVKVGVPKF